jgi:CBS domain-containing protein
MNCRDIMTEDVRWIAPADTIQRAAELMRAANIGLLPVRGDGAAVLGMVTDRDLVVRALAAGAAPDSGVEQFMTRNIVSCHPDDDIAVAENLMATNQIERVLVTDYQDRLIGVISLSDLVEFDTDEGADTARNVMEREAPSPY